MAQTRVRSGGVLDLAVGTADIAAGAITTAKLASGLDPVLNSINGGYLYGNRVINGNQEIDQLNVGAQVTSASGIAYLTDMFGLITSAPSKLTCQQVADAPAGMKTSLKIKVASQYAPATTDTCYLLSNIEGKDVIDFQMGTAGAATFTLSQWIKSSIAGTYSVAVRNSAGNRSYIGNVTVTTSWAQVKVTLVGDVTGTWLTDTNVGMQLVWDLGSGSNYNTTAGSWQAGSFLRTVGSVTFVNQAVNSTLNITGVDCRLGTVAPTVFERRPNELDLCQRYFTKSYSYTITPGSASTIDVCGCNGQGGANGESWQIRFPKEMRAIASIYIYSPIDGQINNIYDVTLSTNIGASNSAGYSGTKGFANVNVALVAGHTYILHYTASARLF